MKGRKTSFNKILAIEMFKAGRSYVYIAQKVNSTENAVRMFIKRNTAELKKKPVNIYQVIALFKTGLTYKEIAKEVNSTEDAIRMTIKKYAPDLMRETMDKNEIVNLFKDGFTYKEIAEKSNSTEPAIKMIIKRYAPELMRERKASMNNSLLFEPTPEEFNLVNMGLLSLEDRKEILNSKNNGINPNESMSKYAFLAWNKDSYLDDITTGRKIFDERRGAISKDVIKSFKPENACRM